MQRDADGRTNPGRWRIGLAALGIGGLMLASGCQGHGHYSAYRGGYGCHSYGAYGYSGDVDLFTGLAVLFVALWAACG